MTREPADESSKPLIHEVRIEEGARAVIAETVTNLYMGVDLPVTPMEPFATVPPLPPDLIERQDIIPALIENLLSKNSSGEMIALEGMGGVGKSVIALTICHNTSIREAFSDGIVWLTVGRQSTSSVSERVQHITDSLNRQFSPVHRGHLPQRLV